MKYASCLLVAILLASCVSFSGGGASSPLFLANFRDTSSFPDIDPFNNVLLLDVTERALFPLDATIAIDNTTVLVQPVTQAGRIEIPFPPSGWAETNGEHEVEISLGNITRSLPFTWHGS